MAQFAGIEFAPLSIPLHRRLQTLAVFQWIIGVFLYPLISIAIILLSIFSPLFYIPLGYLAWLYFYDIKRAQLGGRRFQFMRKLRLWKYFQAYFPISLIKTADLDPNQNYLIGYHPHGILSSGALCNFATEATGFSIKFSGITPHMLTLAGNFYWPILRGYLLSLGACDVSRDSINYILTKKGKGNAAIVVVGGAEEALEAHPGTYKLKLKQRKGFVKMALKTGAYLVPCFSFGENEIFKQASNPVGSIVRKFQDKFKSLLGVSPPIFYGRGVFNYSLGFMPFRHPINTIIGKPIQVKKSEEPSQNEIDELHEQYLNDLTELFNTHKSTYGISDDKKITFY